MVDRFKYDRDLINIKQKDFNKIDEYSYAIHQAFTKYCPCANLKPNEQIQREEEYFYRGLHPSTKTEMYKLGKSSKEAILSTILPVEESLLRDHNNEQVEIQRTSTKE